MNTIGSTNVLVLADTVSSMEDNQINILITVMLDTKQTAKESGCSHFPQTFRHYVSMFPIVFFISTHYFT